MKRKILVILISLFLLSSIGYYISLPNYVIVNSMSFSSENIRDTELKAVIYKYYDIDDTIEAIEQEHNRINGTPTSLEINLYYSRWHLRHGFGPFKTVVFRYKLVNNNSSNSYLLFAFIRKNDGHFFPTQ